MTLEKTACVSIFFVLGYILALFLLDWVEICTEIPTDD